MVEADRTLLTRFGDESTDNQEISIELDEAANSGVSDFTPGDTAFLRVHRFPSNAYQGFTNANSLSKVGTNVVYPVVSEEIIFTHSDQETLDYYPRSGVTIEWIGKDPGVNITFDGKKVIPSSLIEAGVMKATYETLGDRWAITANFAGKALAVMVMGDIHTSMSIVFGGDASEPVDYNLEVIDYCTGDLLAGATVELDGVNIGPTNNLGIIYLGLLEPGSQHTLKIIKAGYLDSDVDNIKNDSFTVPGGGS